MLKVFFTATFFFIVALFPVNAKADTITLSGSVTVTGFNGLFSLSFSGFNTPDTTFSAFGSGSTVSGTNIPRPAFVSGGTSINLSSSLFLLGADFNSGSVTVNGISAPPRLITLNIQAGSVTVPFTNDDLIFLSSGCTVTGGVSGGTPLFTVVSAGFSGLCGAQLRLVRAGTNSSGQGLYNLQSITFNLSAAPVPEPATIVLLGSGMIAVIVRVKRKRSRR